MLVIKHLLGYFILLVSYVFPRISTIWVFGGENNAKYLYYKLNEKAADINCIWISKSKEEVAQVCSLKYKAFYLWSLKGLFYSLIAGRYIYTFSVSDINPWTIGWTKTYGMAWVLRMLNLNVSLVHWQKSIIRIVLNLASFTHIYFSDLICFYQPLL